MATERKLQQRAIWEQGAWIALIQYVNADPDDSQDFKALVTAGMDWIGGDISGDLEICQDMQPAKSLESLATRYRADFRNMLTWLSAPGQQEGAGVRAVEFLKQYGTGKAIQMHATANTDFDDSDSDREGRALIYEWPDVLKSVVSPVCKFILDQIERHDIGREPLRDVIPIGMCDRPGCGKFRLIKKTRGGRLFCSGLCRAKDYQDKMTNEEKAVRMRKYREGLKKMSRKAIRIAKRGGK